MNQPLYRTRGDRMIGGVAAGIARSLGVDPTLMRVAFVILAFVTSGAAVLAYIVLLFVIPEEPWAPPASEPGSLIGASDGGFRAAEPGSAAPTGPAPESSSPPSPAPGAPPYDTLARPSAPPPNRLSADDGRNAALVVGILLVAIGVWFLVRQWLPDIDLGALWPYLAVGGGILLVVISLVGGRRGL